MRWKKMGKIFDPREHSLPNNCVEFAQSPQVLVFDDFLRVYFSTREKDRSGKYLSHISYVDYDKNFNFLRVAARPVMGLGALGCYDEHGIFPLNIVACDKGILGYIGGWNRKVSVSVDGAIGVAISSDQGETFQRIANGPVLGASINEPFLIGDPFVKLIDGCFHMWYIFGKKWEKFDTNEMPDRIYKIGHATSANGIDWKKSQDGRQIVADRLNAEESQALPTVIKVDDRYHMLFCYRQSSDFRKNKDRGYRIGHASSIDLMDWQRNDEEMSLSVTPGEWDSDMRCYPHLFEMGGEVYLMYNGNEFGRYGFGLAVLER